MHKYNGADNGNSDPLVLAVQWAKVLALSSEETALASVTQLYFASVNVLLLGPSGDKRSTAAANLLHSLKNKHEEGQGSQVVEALLLLTGLHHPANILSALFTAHLYHQPNRQTHTTSGTLLGTRLGRLPVTRLLFQRDRGSGTALPYPRQGLFPPSLLYLVHFRSRKRPRLVGWHAIFNAQCARALSSMRPFYRFILEPSQNIVRLGCLSRYPIFQNEII